VSTVSASGTKPAANGILAGSAAGALSNFRRTAKRTSMCDASLVVSAALALMRVSSNGEMSPAGPVSEFRLNSPSTLARTPVSSVSLPV